MAKGKGERQTDFFSVCSKCRTSYSCCFGTRPPITTQRKKIIEDYLEQTSLSKQDAFVEEEYVYPSENVTGYCVFHDMDARKCGIHSVKPETCVAGPITFDINKKTGKIEWHIKMDKICSLVGVVYGDRKVLEKHLESAKKEIVRLVRELDAKALRAILKKDEPETFKIGEEGIEKAVLDKLADPS